jgi:hypothetical protein
MVVCSMVGRVLSSSTIYTRIRVAVSAARTEAEKANYALDARSDRSMLAFLFGST